MSTGRALFDQFLCVFPYQGESPSGRALLARCASRNCSRLCENRGKHFARGEKKGKDKGRDKGKAKEGGREAVEEEAQQGLVWREALLQTAGCMPAGHRGRPQRAGALPEPDSILAKLEFSVIIP